MQRISAVTLFASMALLAGCGKTLDFRNAEISNGSIYETGANTGFTGKVTNIPYAQLPVAPLARVIQLTTMAGGDQAVQEMVMANGVAALLGNGSPLLCDVSVDKGAVDGDATCKVTGAKNPMFRFAFKENIVDGDVVIFDPRNDSVKRAEATFAGGKLDGTVKIYSTDGKVVVNTAELKNGVGEGMEEVRHPKTGKLIRQVFWRDGKQTDKEKVWSADGVVITDLDWVDGKQTGVQKVFDDSGKVLLADLTWKNGKASGMKLEHYTKNGGHHVYHLKDGVYHGQHQVFLSKRNTEGIYLSKVENFVDGNVDGEVKNYDEEGAIWSTEKYVAGEYIPEPRSLEAQSEQAGNPADAACVDQKVAAFRQANDEDALVRFDMMKEWEAVCQSTR